MKFKTRSNYCLRHKPVNKFLSFINYFTKCCKPKEVERDVPISAKRRLISTDSRTTACFEDNIIDNLNTTCIKCMAEDANLSRFASTIEQQYNAQPSPMFKYHISMCFLIFLSIMIVLFISDLKKLVSFFLSIIQYLSLQKSIEI